VFRLGATNYRLIPYASTTACCSSDKSGCMRFFYMKYETYEVICDEYRFGSTQVQIAAALSIVDTTLAMSGKTGRQKNIHDTPKRSAMSILIHALAHRNPQLELQPDNTYKIQ
jgi:hypothetical protein